MKKLMIFVAIFLVVIFLLVTLVKASSNPAEVVLLNSYQEGNASVWGFPLFSLHPATSDVSASGQVFRTSQIASITNVTFYLKKQGNPTGNAHAVLYTCKVSPSCGNAEAILATSEGFDISTLTTSYALYNFSFNSTQQYELQPNTWYCVAYENPTSGFYDSANKVWFNVDSDLPTHEGNNFRYFGTGGWNCVPSSDSIFYVYGLPETVPRYKTVRWNSTRAGNGSQLWAEWQSGVELEGFIVESNNTGTMKNSTFYPLAGTIATSRWNTTLNSTVGTWIKSRIHAKSKTGEWNSTDWVLIQTTAAPSVSLYVDGKYIKDKDGNIVHLRGVNHPGLNPVRFRRVGYFPGHPGGVWNESDVKANLDAMKVWGANFMRVMTRVDYWKFDNDILQNIKRTKRMAELAEERGIYVLFTFWCVNCTAIERTGAIPYPPYLYESETTTIVSKQDWIDIWINITKELRNHPNVFYEFFNEVGGDVFGRAANRTVRDEYMETVQTMIDEMRKYTDQIIVIHWGWGIRRAADDLSWIDDYTFYGYNLAYSTHTYRGEDDWSGDYDTLKSEYINRKVKKVGDTYNLPLIFGETAADANQIGAEAWWESSLRILKEWNIHYAVWWWSHNLEYRLFPVGEKYIPRPINWHATKLIQFMNDNPFVWTVGNETWPWEGYIYSDNIPYTEQWFGSNSSLKINMLSSGSGILRVFWEVWNSDTKAMNIVGPELKVKFNNGTVLNAKDYHNNTTKLITIPFAFDSGTVVEMIDNKFSFSNRIYLYTTTPHLIKSADFINQRLNVAVDVSEGTNSTTQIYIPPGIYPNDEFYVRTNASQWGQFWNNTNRILTVWAVV